MIRFNFKIPIYKINVSLVQLEGKKDIKPLIALMKGMKAKDDDINNEVEQLSEDRYNGGNTYRNMSRRRIVVLFYRMTSEKTRREVYDHEKRHIEDRVLEWFSVDDIESAGLLAGYLGEKFYEFEKLQVKPIKSK